MERPNWSGFTGGNNGREGGQSQGERCASVPAGGSEEYKAQHSGRNHANDISRFKNYLSPLGDKEPRELVPLDVDRLRLSLSQTKKPATVKNVLELLRRLVNFGVDRHLCTGPSFKIKLPKVNNLRTEDLSPEQMARLLDVLQTGIVKNKDGKETIIDLDARAEMLFALYTGMRRGEIFRLKWEDVDLRRGFLTIREPKGGTDQVIPLSEVTRKFIEARPRQSFKNAEGELVESPYVFPGRGERGRATHRRRRLGREGRNLERVILPPLPPEWYNSDSTG